MQTEPSIQTTKMEEMITVNAHRSILSRIMRQSGVSFLLLMAALLLPASSSAQNFTSVPLPAVPIEQPQKVRFTLPWGIVVSYPVEYIGDAGACISRDNTSKFFHTLEPKSEITWNPSEGLYHVKLSTHLFTLYRDLRLIVFDNNMEKCLHPLQEKAGEIFVPLSSLKPLLSLIPGLEHNISTILEYKAPPEIKEVTVVEAQPSAMSMLPSARSKPMSENDMRIIEATQSAFARETNQERQVINEGLRRSANLMTERRTIILDPQPYVDLQHNPTIGSASNDMIPDPPDITLSIAKRCRAILQRDGSLRVLLTRSPGDSASLPDERLRVANTANALGLVSLRLDWSPFAANRGYRFHTAHQSVDPNAFRNLDNIDTPEQLPADAAYMPHEEMSLFLARLLDRGLKQVGIPSAPLKFKPAPFYVLKRAAMPSLSMNLGFWSNTSDRLRMSEKDYVELMAQNLAETLLLYSRLVADMGKGSL